MSATDPGERLDIDGASFEIVPLPGTRPGPTIVFLHEGLGSVALWKDVPARVVELTGLSAVVYSRRGHGRSEVILLGHSDGASIALLAAARPDPRIRRLVLLAPHVFVEDLSIAAPGSSRLGARGRGRVHDRGPSVTRQRMPGASRLVCATYST